jgi:hypothetical protein
MSYKLHYVNYAYDAFELYIIKFSKYGKLICLISFSSADGWAVSEEKGHLSSLRASRKKREREREKQEYVVTKPIIPNSYDKEIDKK